MHFILDFFFFVCVQMFCPTTQAISYIKPKDPQKFSQFLKYARKLSDDRPLSRALLLTCRDHFTRWQETIPITDHTAETVAQIFITSWIADFNTPSTIDRGGQFQSRLWRAFIRLLGTKYIYAYNSISHLSQ